MEDWALANLVPATVAFWPADCPNPNSTESSPSRLPAPGQDPEEANEVTDRRLNEQFAHLTGLLKDAVPEVRAAAVGGVCRVLRDFWEVIPGAVTASYIKLLAGGWRGRGLGNKSPEGGGGEAGGELPH